MVCLLAAGSLAPLGACGDDDGEMPAASARPETCAAYAETEAAVDQFAAVDMLDTSQPEVQNVLDDLVASVEHLSEVADIDDADVLADIDGVVAEVPPGENLRKISSR